MSHIFETSVDNVSIDRRLLPANTKVVVSTRDRKRMPPAALNDLIDLGPGLVFTGLEPLVDAAADGTVLATLTPGFAGQVVAVFAVVTTPATTAAKSAAVQVEIEGEPVSGGVIALTSANATPAGRVVSGSLIVADNEFGAADDITFAVTGDPVDFIEGAVMFAALVAPIRKDGAAAL